MNHRKQQAAKLSAAAKIVDDESPRPRCGSRDILTRGKRVPQTAVARSTVDWCYHVEFAGRNGSAATATQAKVTAGKSSDDENGDDVDDEGACRHDVP
jgi:hypothetical protein